MKHSLLIALLLTLASSIGCDSPGDADAGPGMDVGPPVDAGEEADAGSGEIDAGVEADTGPPAEDAGPFEDAGPVDGDGDGVPAAMDCDDADDSVGASATRTCTSACGDGNETCTNGIWAACDAPTDCSCTNEGENRIADCGFCGERSEQCIGGMWTAQTDCLSQGECAAASSESETTEFCVMRQRICSNECVWGDWQELNPPGECRVGRSESCGLNPIRFRECAADCMWGPCEEI